MLVDRISRTNNSTDPAHRQRRPSWAPAAAVVVSALSIAWLHLLRAATRRDRRTVDSLPEGKGERAAGAPVALRPVMSRLGRAGTGLAVRARPDGMRGGDHRELVVARG